MIGARGLEISLASEPRRALEIIRPESAIRIGGEPKDVTVSVFVTDAVAKYSPRHQRALVTGRHGRVRRRRRAPAQDAYHPSAQAERGSEMNRQRPGPDVRHTTHERAGPGGMPCPECGQPIEMTLDDLLVRHSFACRTPGCGVVLRLDQRRSSEAIDSLRDLKGRLRELGRGS